jgi:hypothetical protein
MPDIIKPYGTQPTGIKIRTFRISIENPAGNPQSAIDKPITFHIEKRPIDAAGKYVGEPDLGAAPLQTSLFTIAMREFQTTDPLNPAAKIKLKGAQIAALLEQAFVDLYNEAGR